MDRIRQQSKSPLRTRTIAAILLGLLCVGGGVTLANMDFSSRRIDRSKVSIETVKYGTMDARVSANGLLLSKNTEELAAQVPGRVARTNVKAGAVVKEGELLVELTNPQLIASAEEAQSAWEGAVAEFQAAEADLSTAMLNQEVVATQAQFSLEKAQLQLDAESRLIDKHIISEIDYQRSVLNVAQLKKTRDLEASRLQKIRDNIKVQLAVRKSRVMQLERAFERAKTQAADLRIVAGISGIVQAISVEVGQQLQPGSPIGRIGQQDQLYAELRVPAREATKVATGQKVIVDTRTGTVDGVITRVDPGVTDGTVIVDVEIEAALPSGSRPQLPIEGTIYVSQIPNTLYVGKPAYVKANASIAVYKVDAAGRYARRTNVNVGTVSVNYVQILGGLQAGDRIITSEVSEWQDEENVLLN